MLPNHAGHRRGRQSGVLAGRPLRHLLFLARGQPDPLARAGDRRGSRAGHDRCRRGRRGGPFARRRPARLHQLPAFLRADGHGQRQRGAPRGAGTARPDQRRRLLRRRQAPGLLRLDRRARAALRGRRRWKRPAAGHPRRRLEHHAPLVAGRRLPLLLSGGAGGILPRAGERWTGHRVDRGLALGIHHRGLADPSGTRLVYTVSEKGTARASRVRDLASGRERDIGQLLFVDPWSADGKLLAGRTPPGPRCRRVPGGGRSLPWGQPRPPDALVRRWTAPLPLAARATCLRRSSAVVGRRVVRRPRRNLMSGT